MIEELTKLREALRRVKYEAVSLADAQVIALEALTTSQPGATNEATTQAQDDSSSDAQVDQGRLRDADSRVGAQVPALTQPAQAQAGEVDERIAELEADYQRLMDKHNALHVNALKHRTDCDTLRAEVERLRVDAERLDHIEKHARCDPKMDGQHVWWPTNFKHALRGNTLRAAIDTARKATP